MPAIGPMLVLGSLGVVGLLFAAKSSAKPAPGAGPAAPGVPPINPEPGTPGLRPELKDIPLPLLQEIARAMELLTVGPDEKIVGPVTEDAIRNATALAGKLEAAGFHEAAAMLRRFIVEAAKKVPSPSKEKQIPLPPQCFTPAEQEQISRLATLERDPKVIRGVVAALRQRAAPSECKAQVELAINTLEAIAVQMEARIAEEEALRRVEEELRKKSGGGTSPGQPVTPSPATPPPSPGSNPRIVIVNKSEGLANITKRLLGSDSRWPELRDRNVPLDADNRRRAKAATASGGITPQLQPGQKLFVPEQWPAMPSIPVPAPVTPPSPSPAAPPPPGSNTRVVIVNKGEGLANITKRLLGSDSRWPELRDRNVPLDADNRRRAKAATASGGITPQLQPGQKLFVPEQWPQMPGIPVSPAAPAPAPVPTPATPMGTGQRITIVQPGDGFFKIAQRLGNTALMTKLRDANVPVDAGGKRRQKADMNSKGGILPILNPGDKLFVPPEFPQSSFAVISGVPLVGIGLATESLDVTEKSPVELAAQEMVIHLVRLCNKHPFQFAKIRHKMDKRKIARFQKEANLPITAEVNPATLIKAAEFGQGELPLVIDWPEGATSEHVLAYRRVISEIAKRADAMNDKATAHELIESVKRERGQAANISIDEAS